MTLQQLKTVLILIALCFWASTSFAQSFNTGFVNSNETIYELHLDDCAADQTGLYAGIRENGFDDKLVFGQYNMNTGPTAVNAVVTYPDNNITGHFDIAPHVEVIQTKNTAGNCDGYLIAISVQTSPGAGYSSHILQLDALGNFSGAYDLFDNGSNQRIYDLKQFSNGGPIVGIGSSTNSGMEELMVFELGYPGIFSFVSGPNFYDLDGNNDGVPDVSHGMDIIQASNPNANSKYICTGTAENHAFVLGLDFLLAPQDIRYYDFDGNPATLTEGIALMQSPGAQTEFYLVGNTQTNDGLGNTLSQGFILGLDADEAAGNFLGHNWDYGVQMPFHSTVFTDAEYGNSSAYVIGYIDTGFDDPFNLNAQSFVLEADAIGVIWATTHDHNLAESVPLDIDVDAQSGDLHFAGRTWSSTIAPINRMHMVKTDNFGNGLMDCYQDIEYVTEPLSETITTQPALHGPITTVGAGLVFGLQLENSEALSCSPPTSCDFNWAANCFDVTLTATGNYPAGTTFQWDVDCNTSIDGTGTTYTHSFPPFPSPGSYCVELTVTPGNGAAPCTIQKQVTVQDVTPPVITGCPTGVTTLQADANCEAIYSPFILVNDNCDMFPTISCVTSPGSSGGGGVFNVGITTVTCTATDASGNSSVCSYTVDVIDNTPPNIICPNDTIVTGNSCDAGVNVNFNLPQFSDNCPPASLVLSHQPGDLFPCGTTTVTATVVDQYGLTDQCTFDVTVLCECPEVELVSIVCDTLAGPNAYELCFNLINPSSTQTLTQVDLSSNGILFNPNPLSVNVPPTQTIQYCVDLSDISGLPTPRNINIGLDYVLGADTCCSSSLGITLPNCCDPCEQPWFSFDPDPLYPDSCCYEMDIIVECPNSLTKILVESITPGAMIGSASLGGSGAPDWSIGTRVPQWVSFDHTAGPTAQVGTYTDLINFCIDDTTNTNSQIGLVFSYYGLGVFGDSLLCADTAYVDCVKEQRCLSIIDSDIYCDSLGNYLFDYTIQNTSSPAFTATNINIALASASGPFGVSPNIVNVPPLSPGATHSGTLNVIGTALPGMNMKLNFSMHGGGAAGRDTCCWEDSTLCVIIPPCDDCCSDSTGFYQATSAQYAAAYGICDSAFVSLSYGDTCIYTDIDWGDGSPIQSHVGPFSTNYLYSSAGNYVVCRTFRESADGGQTFCWSRTFCDTLQIAPCPSSVTPCEEVYRTDTLTYLGWAAVTCYSGGVATDQTFGMKDTRTHQSAPIGSNWVTPANNGGQYVTPLGWTQRTIGDVFGLAVDHRGDYYVSNFTLYPELTIPGPSQWPYGQGASDPSVYRINPHNGTRQLLHSFPQSPDPNYDNQIPGLGNVAHNYVHDLVYVSNLEDGKIYALPASGGAPIASWGHATVSSPSGFAPLGARVFGIGYNHVEERLYYSVWNTDWDSRFNGDFIPYNFNQVYSVGINALTGALVGLPTHEFDVPWLPGRNYSNPVSDISFDSSGQRMMISERTISPYDYNGPSPYSPFPSTARRISSHAHSSRNLEYISPSVGGGFSGTYVAEPAGKFGGVPGNNHSAGGNDYMYGDSLFMACDSAVIFMEDNMLPSSGQWLFGLRGQSASGGSRPQSWMVDLDGNLNDYVKRQLGDVEVLRDLCCGQEEVVICDSTVWGGFDIALDTANCMPGTLPDVAVTPIIGAQTPDWIEFDWGCDGVDAIQTGPTYVPEVWNNTGNFNFLVCVTGYWVINGDTCDLQIIRDLDLELCPDSLPCESIFQDTMSYRGWSAFTQMQDNWNNSVLGIVDTRAHEGAPLNNNWGPPYAQFLPTPSSSSPAPTMITNQIGQWDVNRMGQVFGLAVDPNGNMFVSSFSMYFTSSFGTANDPTVFKVNAYSGQVTDLFTFPQSPDPTYGQDPALGNVAYNYKNDLVYVSNLDDGVIYALDASTPNTIASQFDHGTPDNGQAGFAPLGERIFGIGYNHKEDRLYYAVWKLDDTTGPIPGNFNEVWSIGLDGSGHFSGVASFEFNMPYIPSHGYSMPVADISFDGTGRKMLVSERSIFDGFGVLSTTAHRSRTIEFIAQSTSAPFSSTYVQSPVVKYHPANTANNAVGGNDYMYGDSLLTNCDREVVIMEDHLLSPIFGNTAGTRIYGIRGTDVQGGGYPDSWMIDLDGNLNEYDKRELGDVEVFRNLCCEEFIPPSPCDSLDWEGIDITLSSLPCLPGQVYPDVEMTPIIGSLIPDWITVDFGLDGIDATQSGPTFGMETLSNPTAQHITCAMTAYKIINADTCSITVVSHIQIPQCPPDNQCCTDSLFFVNQVIGNAAIFDIAVQTGVVDIPNIDPDCHLVTINWGDGTVLGPAFINSWPQTHQYQVSNTYSTTVIVQEVDGNGNPCWSDTLSYSRPVSLSEHSQSEFVVFPNPSSSIVNIDSSLPFEYELRDLQGKVLLRDKVTTSGLTSLDVSRLAEGAYSLVLISENGESNKRVMIIR